MCGTPSGRGAPAGPQAGCYDVAGAPPPVRRVHHAMRMHACATTSATVSQEPLCSHLLNPHTAQHASPIFLRGRPARLDNSIEVDAR